MTDAKHAPGYVPNPDYSQEDWDKVMDTPQITDEQWASARPLAEAMPDLVEAQRKRRARKRGPQKAPTKEQIALRVDRDVLEIYRASGTGWQGRMNEALRKSVGL